MTKKKIYGLIHDGGDGSASLQWFSDEAEVDRLLDQDLDDESGESYNTYYMNEGSPAVTLTVDADFDFKAAGIYYIDGARVDQFTV